MAQPKWNKKRPIASLSRSLRAKIGMSRLALSAERFARVFWPSALVFLSLLSLLMWQAHIFFPYVVSIGLYLVLIGVFAYFFWKGLRWFSYADQNEAVIRLDTSAKGNPVASLIDRQFIGADDEGSQELWQLHQKRMAIEADKVEVRSPHIRLAKRDPWAIRLIVLLFFGSAIFFGRANSEQSLFETLQDLASGTTGIVASFEAWADPPTYTGFPTIYLNSLEDGEALELPVGTQLILRNYGTSKLSVVTDVAELEEGQEDFSEETTFKVSQSGTLALKKGFRTVAHWDIIMIPDAPPSVALTEEISRTIQGSVQIPYKAQDDYGIIGGSVKIALDKDKLDRRFGLISEPENTDPITFDLPAPFYADSKDYEDTVVEDLAKHTWAGLPVIITLTVVDAAGNKAAIEPVYTAMPGKRFFDTLAGALAEQRRDILWNRTNLDRSDMILKTLTYLPDEGFPNQRAYLLVRSVIRRIGYTQTRPIDDEMQRDMAETLWRAALLIEDGDLSDAAERLKRAQERLSEAMKNGATDEEIAELMDELRKATDEYLRQLVENAKRQDREHADNENIQQISPEMLQEMMDQIQELMEQGRMEEAQALMDQLQQMLENMQVTNSDGDGDDKDQKSAEGFQDTLREQQDLADENFQEMQEEFSKNEQQEGQNQNNQEQSEQQEGQQQEGQKGGSNQGKLQSDSRSELAGRQKALRDMLSQQLRELGNDGTEAGRAAREALEQAERDMGKAGDNLGKGQGAEALDNQADAVEALRQGMRKLNEANQQVRRGQRQDDPENSNTVGPDAEDPLGRSTAKRGRAQTNEELLRSSDQLRRSKEILEEIRRRSGERSRPQLELDYLDRLLDRF